MESCEHYQKQSFRTRCAILTANGREVLSLPVVHRHDKEPIRETRIDYSTPWQRTLWRAIESAYGGSPFFLYYRDAIQPFFEKRFELLFDYNFLIIKALINALRLPATVSTTLQSSVRKAFIVIENTTSNRFTRSTADAITTAPTTLRKISPTASATGFVHSRISSTALRQPPCARLPTSPIKSAAT